MRPAIFLSALLLLLPASLDAQAKKSAADFERFDVSGLPATPTTDIERQIALFLRVHRKGDLEDATRIHMMLAQYYKDLGDRERADGCSKMAAAAWNAKGTVPVAEPADAPGAANAPVTANSPGKPPFNPEGTFRRVFTYTDDLNVQHTWAFFADGTFSHAKTSGSVSGASEVGWYTRARTQIRLWQLEPKADLTLPFHLLGPDGMEGAVLDGVRMTPAS